MEKEFSQIVHETLQLPGSPDEKLDMLYKIVKPVFFDTVEAARKGTDRNVDTMNRNREYDFYSGLNIIKMVQTRQQASETMSILCKRLQDDSPKSLTRNWAMYIPRGVMQHLYSWTTSTAPHPEGVNGRIKTDSRISKFLYNLTDGGICENNMLKKMRQLTA